MRVGMGLRAFWPCDIFKGLHFAKCFILLQLPSPLGEFLSEQARKSHCLQRVAEKAQRGLRGGCAFCWPTILSHAPLMLAHISFISWVVRLISVSPKRRASLSRRAGYVQNQPRCPPFPSRLCRFPFCSSAAAGTAW